LSVIKIVDIDQYGLMWNDIGDECFIIL